MSELDNLFDSNVETKNQHNQPSTESIGTVYYGSRNSATIVDITKSPKSIQTVWDRFRYFAQTISDIEKQRDINYHIVRARIPSAGTDKLESSRILKKYHDILNRKLEHDYQGITQDLNLVIESIIQLRVDVDSMVLTELIPNNLLVEDTTISTKRTQMESRSFISIMFCNTKVLRAIQFVLLVGFMCAIYVCIFLLYNGHFPTIPMANDMSKIQNGVLIPPRTNF